MYDCPNMFYYEFFHAAWNVFVRGSKSLSLRYRVSIDIILLSTYRFTTNKIKSL